jgi:CBS domain-containing protein
MSLVVSFLGKYLDLPLPEKIGPTRSREADLQDVQVREDEGSENFQIPERKPNRFKKQISEYKKQEENYKKDHTHLPRVRDVMTRSVVTLTPDDTIEAAWNLMQKKKIRHIPLLEDKHVVGLVTQTDILPKLGMAHLKLSTIGVKDIVLAKEHVDLRLASSVMVERRIGCLPIIDDDQIICGIVTYIDILEYFVGLEPFGTRA